MSRFPLFLLLSAGLLAGGACAGDPAPDGLLVNSEAGPLRVTTVTDGLRHPWGMVFLPNGDMLVTERGGQMRVVSADGDKGPALSGLPTIISRGQGGLLDVTLDPDFVQNHLIYFAFSEPGDGGTTSTAVARGELRGNRLESVTVIFSQQPKVRSNGHFGARLVFNRDGTLFVTLGDRQQSLTGDTYPQRLDNHIGKVVRINPDGSVPGDNPFVGVAGALPEIWSYGHRNIQGADLHPTTGALWTGEHGPQGGDEINLTEPGKNYGWPVITYGEQYGGGTIGIGTHQEGMEQPVHYWTPSIANAGMVFYTGDRFHDWQHNLLTTGLRSRILSRKVLEDNEVVHEERLFAAEIGQRLRHIVQGPDGLLYLLTDEANGMILRLEPATP